ncbi:Ku protein [Paracoccus sp. (in: a-proteobacteria)]|uniref:non-homologous end joining protein Ku n=1 Tax=Paracoccus sp. TaxID=267 RepID=UPI00396C6E8A
MQLELDVREDGKMAPRANWKGFLQIGEVSCPVSLYTAASTSDRVSFHTLNRETGHRVRRQYVDSGTGQPVERDDQVKGYETAANEYIVLQPDEIAAAVPDSDKTLAVSTFIACSDIDDVFFDKPYYLVPSDENAEEAFALIREGMRAKQVAALAQTVLFRRVRTVLIRAHGDGLIATTLNFDYEVRAAEEAFQDMPNTRVTGEMLELAEHIIHTKMGEFDPESFDDRYDAALAELVKAKLEGRKFSPRKEPRQDKVVNLMAALRESAELAGKEKGTRSRSKSAGTRTPSGAKTAGRAKSKSGDDDRQAS